MNASRTVAGVGWSLPDAMRISGASYRQLDYWTRREYLRPTGGYGSGNQRLWPVDEVRIAEKMIALTEAGLTVERAAEVARLAVTEQLHRIRLSAAIVVEFNTDRELL